MQANIETPNSIKLPSKTAEADDLIQRFKGIAKRTLTAYLDMASTVLEADESLSSDQNKLFYEGVGIKKGGPTASKLLTIAKNRTRFEPHISALPDNWTTLYQLAKLEPESFRQISEYFTPTITMKELKRHLHEEAANAEREPPLLVTLDLSGRAKAQQSEIIHDLKHVAEQHGLELRASRHGQKELMEIIKSQ